MTIHRRNRKDVDKIKILLEFVVGFICSLYFQVTKQHNEDCKRLLRLMGVPVIEVSFYYLSVRF